MKSIADVALELETMEDPRSCLALEEPFLGLCHLAVTSCSCIHSQVSKDIVMSRVLLSEIDLQGFGSFLAA